MTNETEAAEVAPHAPMIYAAMVGIMSDVVAIAKDRRNQQQGFDYRGIDDVYNGLHGIFARRGVFMASRVLERTRTERTNAKGTILTFTVIRVRYSFIASDGSRVTTDADGEGMDAGDKSTGKAMAIAHRSALCQTFMIPTMDEDPDASSYGDVVGQKITEQQAADILALITEVDADVERFKKWGKVERIEDLPSTWFDAAITLLEQKRAKQ